MKRFVSILMVLVLILGLFSSCGKQNLDGLSLEKSEFIRSESNKDYEYDVYEDYTVITAYIGEDFRVSIPRRLGGKKVMGLGPEAIGSSMLAIEIVDIPKGLVFIDPSAFKGCHNITAFTVAQGNPVYKSEDGIMYTKDGKSVIHYPSGRDEAKFSVPSGVEIIGDYAFATCEKLTDITLPSGVTSLGAHSFDGCTKLVSVNIPEGVTEIKDYCFYECEAFAKLKLPSTLKTIGSNAFNYCISFADLQIPDNVTDIGDSAFYKCETLQKVTLSKSLKTYGYKVFSGCKLLTEINVAPGNQYFRSVEGVLYTSDGKTIVEHPYGKYLKKLIIPSSVTTVRAYAYFRDCDNVDDNSFDYIEKIEFNKVEKIGAYAFANRKSIREVNLPSTLNEISSTSFNNCKEIEKYTIKNCKNYTVHKGVLYTKDMKTVVSYPIGRKDISYEIPEGTVNIEPYAFSYLDGLVELKIPESLETIGDYGFYYSGSITGKLSFGKNLKSIGKYCFSHCAGFEEITFTDNTIKEIPQGSFECLDGAYEFIIPEGVTKIGEDAFREISYIVFIRIPDSVTEICDRAFYDMDDLHELTVPESVTVIGKEIVNILDESNPDKVTLKVRSGSAAEKYAEENNIPYKVL